MRVTAQGVVFFDPGEVLRAEGPAAAHLFVAGEVEQLISAAPLAPERVSPPSQSMFSYMVLATTPNGDTFTRDGMRRSRYVPPMAATPSW